MDTKTISDWLQWAVLGVISLITWLRKPGEDAGKKADQVDSDLRALREQIRHLPTADEQRDMAERLARLEALNEAQGEQLKVIRYQTDRIHDHLLRQ